MPRPRVLSFISQWGGGSPRPTTPTATDSDSPTTPPKPRPQSQHQHAPASPSALSSAEQGGSPSQSSPKLPKADKTPRHSRQSSMGMAYQPPVMEVAQDTPPELQPIFSYLNSHSNKLYQEGYFLKLHDLDARGKPSTDRVWNECFAQLVGTVLSLWDAAQLDAAGEDGEVLPTFINLTDASIKMIESLPMNGFDGQSLQNVLSISTAANNRYLLHFNSLHSLTQWTAGIRLAMYEHATLQEAYTGSIIAGKGKYLNNIKPIMERARFPTEDWARVRFGAGTAWRRCWCVVTPPSEKETARLQKESKKRSAYEKAPVLKGDIKFYDTKKITKKTRPIATVREAYSAYAIYPESKPLIDQSTLVKVEGTIHIYTAPESSTDGFVFIMPEVHPAVTGFEIMLRFLLPIFDTFALYGRPNRLIADVLDTKSLMFAMPTNRRYGYLDLIDVAGLIHTDGSQNWEERDWRKQMKQLTAKRMSAPTQPDRRATADQSRRGGSKTSFETLGGSQSRPNLSVSSAGPGIRFHDEGARSSPGSRHGSPARNDVMFAAPPARNASDTALAGPAKNRGHQRTASDAYRPSNNSRLSFEAARREATPPPPPKHEPQPPRPPQHGVPTTHYHYPLTNDQQLTRSEFPPVANAPYEDEDWQANESSPDVDTFGYNNSYPPGQPVGPPPRQPYKPVAAPPTFAHRSNAQPPVRPNQRPDLRRANSAVDSATLAQLADVNRAGNQLKQGRRISRDDSMLYGPPLSQQPQGPPPTLQQMPPAHNRAPPPMQHQMPPSHGQPPPPPMQHQMQPLYNQAPPPMQYMPSTTQDAPIIHPMPPSQQWQQLGPQAPGTGYRRQGPGANVSLPDRSLPTIPGTPAVEHDNYTLSPERASHTRDRSNNSIQSQNSVLRKPVPPQSESR